VKLVVIQVPWASVPSLGTWASVPSLGTPVRVGSIVYTVPQVGVVSREGRVLDVTVALEADGYLVHYLVEHLESGGWYTLDELRLTAPKTLWDHLEAG
jgi:hypothetical protein